ncbi:pilus assembly protein PilS, partial [Neisseria meningitidis]|nr:pilus assembly protein PilS [Neisseria meningitidis]
MGIQFFEFQSFPINCLSIECLDSRLRGNDESIHTETCTASFLRTYIPSFPRKWESR